VRSNGLDSFSVVWRLERVGRSICVVYDKKTIMQSQKLKNKKKIERKIYFY
jgi:hypothetical protein